MELSLHKRNESELAVKLMGYSKEGVELIKCIPGRRWVPDEVAWSLPYTIDTVERLLTAFSACTIHVEAALEAECYLLQARSKKPLSLGWNSNLEQ